MSPTSLSQSSNWSAPLDFLALILYITIVHLIQHFMSTKLMVELLRRGKTGNEILKILDAVVGEGKLTKETNAIVLNKPETSWDVVSEPAMF